MLKLNKALYSLKQAGQHWYKKILDILTKIGLTHANYKHAVFYQKENNKVVLITFMHVDNITIIRINNAAIEAFKNSLEKYVTFLDSSKIH